LKSKYRYTNHPEKRIPTNSKKLGMKGNLSMACRQQSRTHPQHHCLLKTTTAQD
jgi:hypothetical protein